MKKNIFSFLLSIVFSYGQSQTTTCASEIDLPLIQQVNPARYQRIMALEQHTQNYINSVNSGNNSARLVNPNATIIIPVVVHVLHRNEPIGVGRNISVAQIQSQIDVLNEDFRRLNADRVNTPAVFQPVAADPNFEFRLACIDPNGNPTNGITRTLAGVNQFNPLGNLNPDRSINEEATGIKFTAKGGRDAWPTDRYLNIWVCDMSNGLIGYGQFPDGYSVKPNTDGVVMQFNAFGRVGNLQFGLDRGKVCIHEVGHWLNLRHIWGDANCGNDFVDDTPPQAGPNRGCPAFPRITCNNGPNGDMFMNYMDYTNNSCQNIFTRGQSLRMRAVFAQGGPRASFIDNYFRINQPNTTFCASGTITVRNPNCLPVTWSIVNGSATITAGQGTNSATVQTTGSSGVFRIRATAGGYIDDIDVNFGVPQMPLIYAKNYDNSCGTFAEAYCTNPVGSESFIWNLNFGMVVQENQGYYGSYFYTSPLINSPQTGQYYYNYLSVQAKNSCGVSAPSETWQFTVGPISSSCGSGGGGPILLRVAPNPTPGTVNVETTDNSEFTQLKVVDRNGVVRKALSLPKTKTAILNINDLPADIYRVQVLLTSGWRTATLIKQ